MYLLFLMLYVFRVANTLTLKLEPICFHVCTVCIGYYGSIPCLSVVVACIVSLHTNLTCVLPYTCKTYITMCSHLGMGCNSHAKSEIIQGVLLVLQQLFSNMTTILPPFVCLKHVRKSP